MWFLLPINLTGDRRNRYTETPVNVVLKLLHLFGLFVDDGSDILIHSLSLPFSFISLFPFRLLEIHRYSHTA